MAASIYWDNPQRKTKAAPRRRRVPAAAKGSAKAEPRRTTPWWLSAVIFTAIFGMLLISINYRAFTEMREEASQNTQLQSRVQSLTDENLQLQEEIHSIKTDPTRIEREAHRLGLELDTRR
jgi:cell division protein FtsB